MKEIVFFSGLGLLIVWFSSSAFASSVDDTRCASNQFAVDQEDGSFLCVDKDTDDNLAAEIITSMRRRVRAFERSIGQALPELEVQRPIIDKEKGTVTLPLTIEEQNALFIQERGTLEALTRTNIQTGRDEIPWTSHDVSWTVGTDNYNMKMGSEGKIYASGHGYQRAYVHGYFYGIDGDILENKIEAEVLFEGIHGRAKILDTFKIFGIAIYQGWEYDTLVLPGFEFYGQSFFYHAQYFMLGPVPMVLRTQVSGHVGLNPTRIEIADPLHPDFSRIAARVRPYARLVGTVFCGVDIGIAHAGPMGYVDLLKAEMNFPIKGQGHQTAPCVAGGMERLSTMDGSIGVTAGIGIPVNVPHPRALKLIKRFFGFPDLTSIGFYYPIFAWKGKTLEENVVWFDSCAFDNTFE